MRLAALVVIAACSAQPDQLDAVGRMMLDPLREHALHPRELIDRLALAPDAIVADIGAGPGFLTLPLARSVGRVIATDIDQRYLDFIAAKQLPNVETKLVEAAHPGLAPSSIDLALMCQLDHGLADRAAYFSEVAHALRPGGRIALVNYVRYRDADLAAARAAHLRLVDEWAPSPPFFMLVFDFGDQRAER